MGQRGEAVVQFSQFKGKPFRWLLENDLEYSLYLSKSVQREDAGGFSVSSLSSAWPAAWVQQQSPMMTHAGLFAGLADCHLAVATPAPRTPAQPGYILLA